MIQVKKFTYNGFSGRLLGGDAPYTAEFKHWTPDPGVALFTCSDGKERIIPTFALHGGGKHFPPQPQTGVMFGPPCES